MSVPGMALFDVINDYSSAALQAATSSGGKV